MIEMLVFFIPWAMKLFIGGENHQVNQMKFISNECLGKILQQSGI